MECLAMDKYESAKKILSEYYNDFKSDVTKVYLCDSINDKVFDKAVKSYAFDLKKEDAIMLIDTSMFQSGGAGYIFTDSKMYCSIVLGKPVKVWYDEIDGIELEPNKKNIDLLIRFKDGKEITIFESLFDVNVLYNCLLELVALENLFTSSNFELDYKEFIEKYYGSESVGRQVGNYGIVNKLFDEEKFHARQGHGFAAERANNLYDKLTGKKVVVVGDNNVKDGADRIIKGADGKDILIQSKYCATGSRCINECFKEDGKGAFRYFDSNNKPMQIEVPSDKWEDAVNAMREKIKNGQVQNVTDVSEAENIVRKGHFTYKQAVNLAKAGTVESITYDAVNGVIHCASSFGISFIFTFATNIWNEDDYELALKKSTFVGIKIGGTAFLTTVFASQLSKAGFNSLLVGSSEFIMKAVGYKASAVLINAFRHGTNIYGAAAMKSAAKLLRGNVITTTVTFLVISSFDIVSIFRGRISATQLFKNMLTNAGTIGGGLAGWAGGAAVGTAILPGVGTVVGTVVGAFAGGTAAGAATSAVTDKFLEDDAKKLVKEIEEEFKNLAVDYLLTQNETEKIVDVLKTKLDGKTLKDMYASKDHSEFARELITPIIENQVSKRKHITLPSVDETREATIHVLEDIYDNSDEKLRELNYE